MQRGTLRLGYTNIVVLDEADRMLDIGFKRDIDKIMGMTSRERQVLLFSATIDSRIREISSEFMTSPAIIEVGPVGKVLKIQENFITLSRAEKLQKLKDILLQEPTSRTIVFVASKRGVEYVCHRLNDHDIEARYLHGGKSQSQRESAIRDFQEGRFRILIATDVAARGLHIDNVNHVINYDKADSDDTHTHRIGRTARMGSDGKATTFVETDPLPPKKHGQRGGRGGFGGGHGGGRRDSGSTHSGGRRPRRY